MSLYSLANEYVSRKYPVPAPPAPPPGAPPVTPQRDTFEGLTKYIPVESTTLLVAAMALLTNATVSASMPHYTPWAIYGFCAVLTPIVVWRLAVIAFNKARAAGAAGNPGPMVMPWWAMSAATIAFLVWSLSVPPLLSDVGRMVAGVAALFVSTILSLFEP